MLLRYNTTIVEFTGPEKYNINDFGIYIGRVKESRDGKYPVNYPFRFQFYELELISRPKLKVRDIL